MLFANESDLPAAAGVQVINAICSGVAMIVGAIATAAVTYYGAKITAAQYALLRSQQATAHAATTAAVVAGEVSRKVDTLAVAGAERTELLKENTVVTKATYQQTNGPHTALKRKVAVMARQWASHTGEAEDIRSAEGAEESLRIAIERQEAGHESSPDMIQPKL